MQHFEKDHQLMLSQIHWAAKYPSFEENEADQAAIDPMEVQDERCSVRVEYPIALLIRSATGEHPCCGSINWRRLKKTMVTGSLYEWGQENPYMWIPSWGSLVLCSHILGAICGLSFFSRRKLIVQQAQ